MRPEVARDPVTPSGFTTRPFAETQYTRLFSDALPFPFAYFSMDS